MGEVCLLLGKVYSIRKIEIYYFESLESEILDLYIVRVSAISIYPQLLLFSSKLFYTSGF